MECVTGLAAGVVSKIGEMLVEPIAGRCAYLTSYEDNINNMKEALDILADMKEEVQLRVDADKRSGREIVPRVEEWLREVEEIQRVLGSFNEEASRNNKCLGGWCPNLNSRYSFSRKAKENRAKLVHQKEKKPETISIPAPPLQYGAIFPSKGIKSFESRNKIIDGVIKKLKDEGCNRISICGMGGVGKTTLVKEVIKIVETEKLFGEIVIVTVSQTVDNWKIQGQIADRLGLTLAGKESLQGRAHELLRGIINKNTGVLIVLDDVWTELDFESIGLPSNGDQKACKVIFTSRNEGECSKMGSQKNFTVDTLSGEDSWALFQEMTGGDVVNNSDIRTMAEEIANKCGGLPIAIVAVGKALQGKKAKYHWEYALSELRKSSASFSEVEKCIELSYNILDRERSNAKHKHFLFLCCSFPEDADIPIEDLLREGWGLGLFQDQDALWEARNEARSLVNDLKSCYLLLDSDDEVEECVKMHDVVRDVITSIASKKENDFKIQCDAQKWWQEKSTLNSSRAVSIIIDKVKECPNVEEYPKLELLRVRLLTHRYMPIPTNFFQGMSKLKALYLAHCFIPNVSPLFPALNNLRTLRLECCRVGDASVIGKELLALEILSFAGSDITELPTEIGQLGSLRLLDLTECDHLCKISANVLAGLYGLEELYFRVNNFPWMQNNEFLGELKSISRQLKVVDIRVRKVEPLLKDLISENVRRFWVCVTPYFDYASCRNVDLNELHLEAVNYNSIECGMIIEHLVKRCEILVIEKVKNIKNISCTGLPHLKELEISDCSNLEHLINEGEDKKSMSDFSNLVKLMLKGLPKLIRFSKANDLNKSHQLMPYFPNLETVLLRNCNSFAGVFDLQGFQNLRALSISGCNSLTHIFTSAIGGAIPQLEKLEIMQCEQMTNLVGRSKDHEVEDYNGEVKTIVFNKLYHLSLSQLPMLESICANSYEQKWPSLRQLKIDDCPILKTPSFQNQLPQESNSLDMVFDLQGFQNLRALKVSNCDSLTHIVTPAIGRVASELEELMIKSCKQMANLVGRSKDHEEEDNKAKGKVNTIVFKKLYSLSLFDLPKLECICSNSYDLEWPSLRKVDIDRCPMLKTSSFQTQMVVMQDNAGVTSCSNIHKTDSSNSKENKSRPCNWLLGCAPLLPKFIHQANTKKTSNKATTLAQDQISSIFKLKSMPILEYIRVRQIDPLDILFSLEENYNPIVLSYLKTIKIEDCDKLESIMAKIEERTETINYFAQLQYLYLKNLPNLVRFCFSRTCTSLDKHQDMDACEGDQRQTRLDPLIDVFLFPNLRSLFIERCNKIRILFSPSSLRSLECLKMLDLQDCENIEEIVSQEEIEASAGKIMFLKLQHLLLQGLPNIKAFSQGPSDFDFPSLQTVGIEDCPNMEMFSQGSVNTPQLKDFAVKMERHGSNYIHKEDLNASIKGFKAFVKLQGSEMLHWSDLGDEGLIYLKNPEMDIKMFHKLLMVVPFNEIYMLQNVKKLNIKECDLLFEVFEYKEGVDAKERDVTIHYEMQSMNLKKLPKLRHIWGPNIMGLVSFNKLTSIVIKECHSLKSLLSYSMVKSLVQLQELSVTNCEMIEEIVIMGDEKGDDKRNKVKILFPELKKLKLDSLPKLECVCSRDYDYNIPLCDEVEKEKEINNKQQVQISFPQLQELVLHEVPMLKCFYPAAYDYELILSSSCVEDYTQITTFPNGNVIVSTPNLHEVHLSKGVKRTMGDINLTIHYFHNPGKYKVELQNSETFRCIGQHQYQYLLGYIARETWLVLESCHKLLNCIPSDMMHLFQHLKTLEVRQCGCLEEIFESTDYEGMELYRLELNSLPKLKHIWRNHGSILGFQNLSDLIISECHDLKYVFPHVFAARSLQNLHQLVVHECNKMEAIILNNDNNISMPKGAKIILKRLRRVELKKLPELNCFCQRSFYLELQVCIGIRINECPKMKTFCYGTLYAPELRSFRVDGRELSREEEMNEVIQ